MEAFVVLFGLLFLGVLLFGVPPFLDSALKRTMAWPWGRWLVVYYVWITVALGATCLFLPTLAKARPIPPSRSCRLHLKVLRRSLAQYAKDHDGLFPAKLSELYPTYSDWRDTEWWNPLEGPKDRSRSRHGSVNCYTYTPGLGLDSPPDTIVIRDRSPSSHDGTGWNSLSVGGEIEWHWTALGPKRSNDFVLALVAAIAAAAAAVVALVASDSPQARSLDRPSVHLVGMALCFVSWGLFAWAFLYLQQRVKEDQAVWLPDYGGLCFCALIPSVLAAAHSVRVCNRLPQWGRSVWSLLGVIGIVMCAAMYFSTWLIPWVSALSHTNK